MRRFYSTILLPNDFKYISNNFQFIPFFVHFSPNLETLKRFIYVLQLLEVEPILKCIQLAQICGPKHSKDN